MMVPANITMKLNACKVEAFKDELPHVPLRWLLFFYGFVMGRQYTTTVLFGIAHRR
jgi:hypothetical protein